MVDEMADGVPWVVESDIVSESGAGVLFSDETRSIAITESILASRLVSMFGSILSAWMFRGKGQELVRKCSFDE